jgi:tetratricopeptide (TPR) repeat protein
MAFVFGILAGPPRLRPPHPAEQPVSLAPLPLRLAGSFAAVLLLFQCVRFLPGEYFAEGTRIELQNENPEAAIVFADKALVYEQNNPNIYFYLGRALGALADDKRQSEKRASYYEAAIGAFDHARRLVPLDGTYPLDMAFAYDNMGRFTEAEWMYNLARGRDPQSVVMSHLYQHHLATWRTYGTQVLAADSGGQ